MLDDFLIATVWDQAICICNNNALTSLSWFWGASIFLTWTWKKKLTSQKENSNILFISILPLITERFMYQTTNTTWVNKFITSGEQLVSEPLDIHLYWRGVFSIYFFDWTESLVLLLLLWKALNLKSIFQYFEVNISIFQEEFWGPRNF